MENNILISEIKNVANEKGLSLEIVLEALETSLVNACKRHYGSEQDFEVVVDRETGKIDCFSIKKVVEEVFHENSEISLEEANSGTYLYELGDEIKKPVSLDGFSRIAAMTAKQVISQKFREVEKERLFKELSLKEHKLLVGKIERKTAGGIIVSTGNIQGLMTNNGQVRGEEYYPGDRIKVYVSEVKETTKDPIMYVSRAAPELVRLLFEAEVPELIDGIVEIKAISREAGMRTKIAVISLDEDIDPIGALVGPAGSRINVVIDELNGEKIDIVPYSEELEVFIQNALAPSKINNIALNLEEKTAIVTVPKTQLSLAIGKDGQNVRLAVRLTGFKIDIQGEEEFEEEPYEDYQYVDNDEDYEDMYKEAFGNENE
ncbi:MAG: transcription termination factor NusA [Defluviitaleaceae bacterium]|nr:transcription termination factor NusA [Defluviitaleaceae bacterium]